jgi:hypothetical protein
VLDAVVEDPRLPELHRTRRLPQLRRRIAADRGQAADDADPDVVE